MIEYRNLRIALLGGGNVGAQVARLLLEQSEEFANRVGAGLELVGILVRDVDADYLPGDVGPGDLLAVAATGAYCFSLASNYNYLGRPPVVAVHDGAARLLVRGETIADLLSRDTGITAAVAAPAGTDQPKEAIR